MSMFININPELGKPEGSYFGLCVADGYDWGQCYSWAWEVKTYFDGQRSVWECFPDVPLEDEIGLMHQCIAIAERLTDMPKKRFFIKQSIKDIDE